MNEQRRRWCIDAVPAWSAMAPHLNSPSVHAHGSVYIDRSHDPDGTEVHNLLRNRVTPEQFMRGPDHP